FFLRHGSLRASRFWPCRRLPRLRAYSGVVPPSFATGSARRAALSRSGCRIGDALPSAQCTAGKEFLRSQPPLPDALLEAESRRSPDPSKSNLWNSWSIVTPASSDHALRRANRFQSVVRIRNAGCSLQSAPRLVEAPA